MCPVEGLRLPSAVSGSLNPAGGGGPVLAGAGREAHGSPLSTRGWGSLDVRRRGCLRLNSPGKETRRLRELLEPRGSDGGEAF